ncbi:hypothetical protein [uncultured Modestobacter sp.]|uniref:hypothetical protein n=1 Tax=uncultured Modestobacter sp. TaxID=380048 RepID=UPI00261D47AF|nr:hypothetical protein [uncultured Modestobacter sp.]
MRNAAAHMGLVDPSELHTAMLTMLRYVDSALTVKAESARTFWGEDLAALASELLSEAMTQRRRIVAAKQAAARARLATLLGDLDETARTIILASLSGHNVALDSEVDQPQTCPVCNQRGWLYCGVEMGDVLRDEQSGAKFVARTAHPVTFMCFVCGLDIERDELDEFAFPDQVELEPLAVENDSDPDEDWLRDR